MERGLNERESGDGMKEERNDFVTGLILFLLAMGVILAALTYAIVGFQ